MTAPKPASLFERLGGRAGLMRLLRHFYADVRQHRVLGPVFAAQISDWPAHLEKIADFWTGATGGPAHYQGPMPAKHLPLGLTGEHFGLWLDLWGRNCRAQLPAAEADQMVALAGSIGERLQHMISLYGRPANGLTPPAPKGP